MPSKNEILTNLFKSEFIEDALRKITSNHELKEDLRQELFLILLEKPDAKIKDAYDNCYLAYLCINILKKQYHSKTSPFHKTYRKERADNEFGDIESVEIEDTKYEEDEMIKKIIWIIDNKLDLIDRELFKLYYKLDRYDRWLGELRDTTCTNPTSSYRKIAKKLSVTTINNEKDITVGRSTICQSHQRSILIIKKNLGLI